jgi:hypothetical protein
MNFEDKKNGMFYRFIDKVFPKSPDFFTLLHQQSEQVCVTMDNLDKFLHTNDLSAGELLHQDEHIADTLRVRNLHQLNQAFSTTIDREDIYRAIDAMDGIVTHCKNSFNEITALELIADETCLAMVKHLHTGVKSIEQGFSFLAKAPLKAQEFTMSVRHHDRKVERLYYEGLATLFKSTDTIYIFKMKEFYMHLKHISIRMNNCANVLEDIIVKIS